MSKLLFNMLGAFAEFERELIRERQREGIAIAKAQGRYAGRTPSLTPEQIEEVKRLAGSGIPKAKLARDFKVSRGTIHKAIKS